MNRTALASFRCLGACAHTVRDLRLDRPRIFAEAEPLDRAQPRRRPAAPPRRRPTPATEDGGACGFAVDGVADASFVQDTEATGSG
ncbi:hypothetical protein ACFYNL_19680 [Streptomyces sp. NPDC007808]|uniref:hypothetical protein n=1 Tax=Streptomyces sp. NPDC007808 TaxID=3364779 RepID=UPI00368D5842